MIRIRDIKKHYKMGDSTVYALNGVSLTIESGDFVAIMGPSGSGKSTLMHILGLLDVPDSGSFELDSRETSHLKEDELAVMRREAIGFIFQQFNLLPRMNAAENVSLPLLYSEGKLDLERARQLLARVSLEKRLHHRPNELSGGQQQRVAIARSLINRPRMILADEPTGNLDSVSEKEIMATLHELNNQGITIVIVTHEDEIGKQAKRLIRLRDGVVQSDERLAPFTPAPPVESNTSPLRKESGLDFAGIKEYFLQGLKTLAANKVRTALSMLGILIGVAAVVAMLALGRGAQSAIEAQLASLGSNLLVLRTGSVKVSRAAVEAGSVTRLTLEDAALLQNQISAIKETAPTVTGKAQATFLNKNANTSIVGVGASYARMRAAAPDAGRFFTEEENRMRARVAVLGTTVVRELFGEQSPVGEMIKINKVMFQVIGVLPERGANGFRDQDDVIVIPVLTAMHRLLGKDYVDYIDIEVTRAEDIDSVQQASLDLMYTRHRIAYSQRQDAFQVRNMADIKDALAESSNTMSVLLASIAAISLLVGGIGIMNIMLVSVTERTREIGLRKAVGARRNDILAQFLAEAVVVSAVGGMMGIILGWVITVLMSLIAGWSTSITGGSVFLAFFFSASIGVIFGIYPAKKAALLNPIQALRHD